MGAPYELVSSTASSVGRGVKRVLSSFERILVGVWLLCWYILAVIAVLGTLGAFQFQRDLSSEFTVAQVRDALYELERKAELAYDRTNTMREIKYYEREKSRLEQQEAKARSIADVERDELGDDIEKFKTDLNEVDRRIAYLRDQVSDLEARIAGHKETYPILYDSGEEFSKLKRYVNDYSYMARFSTAAYMPDFISMPPALLTLTLTLAMGALGSVIHQTWEFFNKEEGRRISWYIFRPLLGAVLAFVIYILLKAGQMFITATPEGTVEGADLNPFFVSFLAIVSGLLSEQAYARISSAGNSVLRPPVADTPRWVRRSVADRAVADQGKNWKQLVPYVGVPQPKIHAWVTEQERVPETAQGTMAAWLSLPPRELFTDQAPERASDEEEKAEQSDHKKPEEAAGGMQPPAESIPEGEESRPEQ